eukprot:gene34340-biopygen26528
MVALARRIGVILHR